MSVRNLNLVPMIAAIFVLAATDCNAAPTNVCIYNNNVNSTLWVHLHHPGGATSNFSIPPRGVERRQGDSAGLVCWAFQPFTDPQCPYGRSENDFRCN